MAVNHDEFGRSNLNPVPSDRIPLYLAMVGICILWLGPFVSCMAFWRLKSDDKELNIGIGISIATGLLLMLSSSIRLLHSRKNKKNVVGYGFLLVVYVVHLFNIFMIAVEILRF